jgi:multiple sugar transport system substrate-binding protein
MIAGAALGLTLLSGAARAQTVEIEYWQYFFDSRVKVVDQLIKKFEAENPGIKVKHTHFPYADYRTKVAAAIPAGQGPDVVQLFYGWLNEYIDAKLIVALPADAFPPAKIEAEFFPMVKAMRRGDAYYALPTAVRSLALFYNKRLMTEAGLDPEKPPTTLDELVAATRKLAKKDATGNLTQVGIAMDMTAQDHHWWREVLVRQYGGAPYSADNRQVTYDDTDAGTKAMQFLVDLIKKEEVAKPGFMDETQAAFRAGRAGLMVDGSFRIGALNNTRGLQWGVTELPAGPDGKRYNYASYWVNSITSKAAGPKLEAAKKFMAFMTTAEAMKTWLDATGELPARMGAVSPEMANHPQFGAFVRGLSYATATEFVDESAQRQLMVDLLNRVTLNNQPVRDAVLQAAKEEQALLDKFYKK